MVPAAFPIFPALAWHCGGCTTAHVARRCPPPTLKAFFQGFIDWLWAPVYEVSLQPAIIPAETRGCCGVGQGDLGTIITVEDAANGCVGWLRHLQGCVIGEGKNKSDNRRSSALLASWVVTSRFGQCIGL
jgi:hypothetical protein